MSNPETLQGFRMVVVRAIALHAKRFRTPTDDWSPYLGFVQSPNGVEVCDLAKMAVEQHGGNFTDDATKDAASRVMKAALAVYGAYRYATVMNGHFVHTKSEAEVEVLRAATKRGVRLASMPAAKEGLTMAVGDAETEEFWEAPILRDRRRVRRVGSWSQVQGEMTGRFIGMNELLRQVQEGS